MATNPFDINQLNGVTFDAEALAKPYSNFLSFTDNRLPVTAQYVYAGSYETEQYQSVNPGTITVTSDLYSAGYTRAGSYIFPSFGSIQFSGILNVDGTPKTYWIHGFSETSLLLSPLQYTGVSGNFTPTGYYNSNANGLSSASKILSSYGFPDNGPVNLTFGNDSMAYTPPPVCFAEGTPIETPAGPVAVEYLAEGDLILTASGVERPVKWIGQMLVRPASRARPHEVNPVRVKAHAFGPDLPARDVRLSPGHSVLVDGVLVPVGLLINGATIVQEGVESVRYFHVELETHDVLLAEGLACESYFDDGNRSSFANAGPFAELHGRLDPQSWDHACAPMVAAGPQLAGLQQRLQAQAESLGWVKTEEAALTIAIDGATIAPVHVADNRYWFAVPACTALTLRSNAGVLAHVLPGLGDRRTLGVAVSELRVDGIAIDLDTDAFGVGFHAIERSDDHAWRWTDGTASMALAITKPAMIEVTLLMVAPSWTRRVPDLRVVA